MKKKKVNLSAATTSYISVPQQLRSGLDCGAAMGLQGIPTLYTHSAPNLMLQAESADLDPVSIKMNEVTKFYTSNDSICTHTITFERTKIRRNEQ